MLIRQYLSDIINNHKNQNEWIIQLSLAINFVSSKDFKETCIMYTNCDNIDIMIGNETDEIIKKLSESPLERYQKGLEEKIRESEFVYDSIGLLHYKLHKISLNHGGSYIDSPEWLKNKIVTINSKNNDEKCFVYIVTVAINYQNINNHLERVNNINPFTNKCNWKEIANNKSIALNVTHMLHIITHAYKSKYNLNRENQVILSMITDGKKWHYLAVKKSALVRGITAKHDGNHYCLNCLHSLTTRKKTNLKKIYA